MKSGRAGKSFVTGAAVLAAAGLLCKIIGVFIRVWAYGIIGEEGMVYYEAAFPFYNWLLIISSSGVPIAVSRMVARAAALNDLVGARKILKKSGLLLLFVGLITSALMYFGADWFALSFIGKDASYILGFRFLAPALLFVSVMCAYRGYLQGMQNMNGTALSQICEQVVKCAAGLFLAGRWIARGPEYGAAGILAGIVISEAMALGIVMAFTYVNRKRYFPLGASPEAGEDTPVIKTLLGIAVPITLGASILPLTSLLDVRMVFSRMGGYMAEAEVNRSYVVLSTNVRSLVNLPSSLTQSLSMALVPAITAAQTKNDLRSLRDAANLGLKIAMAIGMPCAAGLFVLGVPVIKMLFSSITPESVAIAEHIMPFAATSVIFISLVQTMAGELQGIGKHRIPVWCLLAGGVAKVITNYLLLPVPSVNIAGASISNIVCYAVAGIADLLFFMKYSGYTPDIKSVFVKPLACSVIMGAATYGVYKLLYSLHPGPAVTVVCICFGVAVYGVSAVACSLFTREELNYIPGGTRLKRFFKE